MDARMVSGRDAMLDVWSKYDDISGVWVNRIRMMERRRGDTAWSWLHMLVLSVQPRLSWHSLFFFLVTCVVSDRASSSIVKGDVACGNKHPRPSIRALCLGGGPICGRNSTCLRRQVLAGRKQQQHCCHRGRGAHDQSCPYAQRTKSKDH